MLRLFTKNATGISPDGRWFAGDINALQDAVAAINDLTQTLGIGSLQIGEAGLQFLRYGPSEARISGALRTDGILRALGGDVPGAFTTTQRDAIPAGSRPYGLRILNTTTNQFEWNSGTDAAPNWVPISAPIAAPSINAQVVAAYTLALSDAGNFLEVSNVNPITVTVPPNSAVPIGIGETVTITQTGTGQITIAPGAGVTVNGNPGLKLAGQWAAATLIKRAANVWNLVGNTSS